VHSIKGSGRHLDRDQRRAARAAREHVNPEFRYPGGRVPAHHPIARRHPATGRTALYVNSLVGTIDGWDPDEADDLLDDLMAHANEACRTYGHAWQQGDLVIFDDVGTMHRRDPSDPAEVRTMRQLSTLLDDDV
jgi:alpha-ketoglutarate-dependent taurine dioxygenase